MTSERTGRVSKRAFLSRVSARSGLPLATVSEVYESFIHELLAATSRREAVVLFGFGRFYSQAHKGHKVRFGKTAIAAYSVLKFSASQRVNRKLTPPDAESTRDDSAVIETASGRQAAQRPIRKTPATTSSKAEPAAASM